MTLLETQYHFKCKITLATVTKKNIYKNSFSHTNQFSFSEGECYVMICFFIL